MNRPAASASPMQRSRPTIRTAPAASASPRSSALPRAGDRVGADRRHVEPQVLPALRRLDQHARRPLVPEPTAPAHLGDAGEHRVGALGRLDRQHPAGRDHRALPRVVFGQRGQQPRAEGDVGLVLGRRAAPGERARRRHQPRRDLVGADDPHPFALEDRREAGEQAVVAAAKELRQFAGAPDRAPVEPEFGQFGTGDRADHRHLGRAALLQRGEQLADLAEPNPGVRIGRDGGVRDAGHADHQRLAAGPAGVGCDLERKRAGAAQDGERRACGRRPGGRRVHASSPLPSRGTQIARSPPSRRNSTTCCTSSWPGKASATSPTRSLRVPLPENSIR